MEGDNGVSQSIIDEFHSWDIQGHQMKGESCVPRSLIGGLSSSSMILQVTPL